MEIIDGKMVSKQIKQSLAKQVKEEYLDKGKNAPTLACILVGDDPASHVYVANKQKACKLVGINSIVKVMPQDCPESEVAEVIENFNQDQNVSGILLQLPLPKHLNEGKLINLISPQKDVDCLTEQNLGKLFSGHHKIAPCTATGIIELLDQYNIEIQGKHAVVVGRSLLVGKSVASLLEKRNATVTLCHSKTTDLASYTKQADILVVAVGKPKLITSDMIKDGTVVIDVGINRLETGLVGDVDYENVKDRTAYITPVPGGVGPMTIAMLLKNTLILHEENNSLDNK